MTISRRSFLLAAVVTTTAAACSASRSLTTGATVPRSGTDDASVGDGVVSQGPANPPRAKVPKSVTMVGDSITALSKVALESVLNGIGFSTVTVDAEPKRRIEVGGKKPKPGLDVITFIAASDAPDLWVVALGTNDAGQFATDDEYRVLIDDVLAEIPKSAPLVWVNTYRADQLQGCEQFNGVLQTTLKSRGNATVADWYQRCVSATAKILIKDGVHPNARGILVFADTVRGAIAERLA